MTYRELWQRLNRCTVEQLDQDVTLQYGADDFTPSTGVGISKDGDAADGILDHGHLYLEIKV